MLIIKEVLVKKPRVANLFPTVQREEKLRHLVIAFMMSYSGSQKDARMSSNTF